MNGLERTAALLSYLSTLQAHLATHRGLAGPFGVAVDVDNYGPNVTVQLDANGRLHAVAGGLLTWADSLADVTADMWRTPAGIWVHLSLTGITGSVSVKAFDAVLFDPAVFGCLSIDERRPISLGELRAWALGSVTAVAA